MAANKKTLCDVQNLQDCQRGVRPPARKCVRRCPRRKCARPPARKCVNCHMSCSPWLRECASCKLPYFAQNPAYTNSLLATVPRLCCYSRDGCRQVFYPTVDHENNCGYRRVTCREPGCEGTVSVNQMREHYRENHPKVSVVEEEEFTLTWVDFKKNQNQKVDTPVFVDNHFFYFNRNYTVRNKCVRCSLEAFFIGKPHFKYYLNITIRGFHFKCNNTVESIVMDSNCGKDGWTMISEKVEDATRFCSEVSREELEHRFKYSHITLSMFFFIVPTVVPA